MDPSDMLCNLCPVLSLAPLAFAPAWAPWMDPGYGSSPVNVGSTLTAVFLSWETPPWVGREAPGLGSPLAPALPFL